MNWRDPKETLPADGQIVWIMLHPHKDRGSLLESAPSIEIVAGWVSRYENEVIVDNFDELGMGSVIWNLVENEEDTEYGRYEGNAIAWLPVEEMPLPNWKY